jgi:hypothetical protein
MIKKKEEIDLDAVLEADQEDSVVKDESINTEEKPKMSQKAENLFSALREYVDENNGDAFFDIEFGSLDESGGMSESHRITSGDIHKILSPNQDDSVVEEGSSNSEVKPDQSQEAKNIFRALDDYAIKHNGEVYYYVGFGAFDEESCKFFNDRFDMYGPDDLIKISLGGMLRFMEKKKLKTDNN